jgi:hypothetical protein
MDNAFAETSNATLTAQIVLHRFVVWGLRL